jgi:hypothetical protein
MENVIRGYKVADSNGKCRGYQFEVGKRYKYDGNIKICESGFHFCIKASHCFNYYSFSPGNKVFEVIGYGEHQTKEGDSKVCVGDIEIVRELTWQEVLVVSNEGKNNTGHSNSGHSNSGHSNSGYRNSGNYNSGHSNSGNYNSGNYNSGYRNSGHSNSGHSNRGHSNSGHSNSGNYNSGDSNSGNYNSGVFNTNTPTLRMFNKETNWTWDNYNNSRVYNLIKGITPNIWVESKDMTEDEKKSNPNYDIVGGYLKVVTLKESWVNLWKTLSEDDKGLFYKLPNFDWDVFTEITSITKE